MRSAADSPWRLPARHPRTPGSISNRPFYEGINLRQGFLSEHRKLSSNVRRLDTELGLRLGQSANLLLIDPSQGNSLTGLKERLPVFTRLQTLEENLDELRTAILEFGDPVLDSASCR